jgi:hypothetical protein
MATLAQLDYGLGQTVISVFQSNDSAHGNLPETGPTVVIDGKNPMPDVGWTTADGGLTFTAPAADSKVANRKALQDKAVAALQANIDFLAIVGTPSNLQVLQQVQRLTKECTGVIRLLLDQLDSQAGT